MNAVHGRARVLAPETITAVDGTTLPAAVGLTIAGAILGIAPRSVLQAIAAGRLRATRAGSSPASAWLVDLLDLQRYAWHDGRRLTSAQVIAAIEYVVQGEAPA